MFDSARGGEKMHYEKSFTRAVFLVSLAVIIAAGCSGSKDAVKKDPFFEKWRVLAEKSQGTSPVGRKKELLIPGEPDSMEVEKPVQRALPRNIVTLKVRDADIITVLRSLARTADLNMLIKSDVQDRINVSFNKVPWNEAFLSIIRSQNLSYVWEGDILRIVSLADIETNLEMETLQDKIRVQEKMREQTAKLHTMVIPIDYADAEDITEDLQGFLTKDAEGNSRGSITVNSHTNSLIIQATREDYKKIIPMIEEIDTPTPQIRIEANIIETTSETARSLGIQWGGVYANAVNGNQYFITPGGSAGTAGQNPTQGGYVPTYGAPGMSGQGFGVNFPITPDEGAASLGLLFGKIGGSILDVQLQALEKDGKLNIISRPSITTLDNQTAYTENGEKVPYVTVDEEGNREVNFEDAVLRLEITPHVIDGRNLKMKIQVKKDEVDFTRSVDGNPLIIKKETDTKLIVQDGETIVISGLSKRRLNKGDSGVPGLKNIPGLGYLFKGESKEDSMEEVLVFITPHILRDAVSPVNQTSGQ